jgi:hypothetical protein
MNTEYKCPYCYKENFINWLSVKRHTPRCKQFNGNYIICDNYGPIKIDTINSYENLKSFLIDYPLFTPRWSSVKNNSKITLRFEPWSKDLILQKIKNFYVSHNKIPQKTDFQYLGDYPNFSTVQRKFGSWNNAIEAAGFTATISNTYGVPTKGLDGILYKSQAEAYFSNKFLYGKHQYEYEKPYGNGWYSDFYLPELDLYVEIDGGLRPERIEEKIQLNKKILVIKTKDLFKEGFKVPIKTEACKAV